jgi:hypothetical protein
VQNYDNHLFSKSGISRETRQQMKNCCPAGYTYINKQKYGGATCKFINSDFPSLDKIKNVKEKKNTQQVTGYA